MWVKRVPIANMAISDEVSRSRPLLRARDLGPVSRVDAMIERRLMTDSYQT